MTQAEKADTVAGSALNGNQQPAAPRKASREDIAATATAVVAEVITTAHGEAGLKENLDSTGKEAASLAPATSEVKGGITTAPDKNTGEPQMGASPRPIKPGGDLRASFLAAVGNTISQTVRSYWNCTAPLPFGRI